MGSTTSTTTYGTWLKAELDQRGWGIRTLARKIDPARVDSIRRKLVMYVHEGVVPGPESRREVEVALGVQRGSSPDEGEEDD